MSKTKFILNGKIALVSGANRGLGKAIVEQLIKKGVKKVYAGSRTTENLKELVAEYGDKIIPIELDLTKQETIDKIGTQIDHLDILVNNAGVLSGGALLSEDAISSLHENLVVNVYGLVKLSNTVRHHFINENQRTAIVNISSVAGLANMPPIGTYSVSKAAVHSITQGMRTELANKNTQVIGVYPGAMDTAMLDGWDMEKADTTIVAKKILNGIENGDTDIFPDNQSEHVGALYSKDPKGVEEQFAAMA